MTRGHEAVLDVGDISTAFHAVDSDRAASITRLLCGLLPHAEPPQTTMRYLRRRPGEPRRRADHAYEGVRVWHSGSELFVQLDEGAAAKVTPDDAWIGGEVDDLDGAWHQLFHFAVTHVLAHRDRFVLHGAGLVPEAGGAYVVLGDSGQGKSTLALAALASGWRLLGDDLVVVRNGPIGPEVAGISRRVAVPGELGPQVEARGRPLAGDHRGRWELPLDTLSRGWFPVAGVMVVGHGSSPCGEMRALSGEETMYKVLGAFSSVTDPLLLHRFFPVAGSVSRLDRWYLGHGTDPATRVSVGQRLLGQLSLA